MFVESSTLSELVERKNANRSAPMNGISGIVVDLKQFQRWCAGCICSVDCQCNSCVYGCLCSVDCQCYFCLNVCSEELNEGDNEAAVGSCNHAIGKNNEINLGYNEDQVFDECPQWVEYEILVELQSIHNKNTTEIEIVDLSLYSRLHVLDDEDTTLKLMDLDDLPCNGRMLDIEFGENLFDIKLDRHSLTACCAPLTTTGLLPHALDFYNCNWVDTGKVFLSFLDWIKLGVHSFSRVLLFSYSTVIPFPHVVDAEAKLPTFAMKSADWCLDPLFMEKEVDEDALGSAQLFFVAYVSQMPYPFDFTNWHLLAKPPISKAKMSIVDILDNSKFLAKNEVFEIPTNWGDLLLMGGNKLLHIIKFLKLLFHLGYSIPLCLYQLPPDQFRLDFPFDPGCSLLTPFLGTTRHYSIIVVDDLKEIIQILSCHIDSSSNDQSILNQFPFDFGENLFIVTLGHLHMLQLQPEAYVHTFLLVKDTFLRWVLGISIEFMATDSSVAGLSVVPRRSGYFLWHVESIFGTVGHLFLISIKFQLHISIQSILLDKLRKYRRMNGMTQINSWLGYTLGLHICNWFDISQVLWTFFDGVELGGVLISLENRSKVVEKFCCLNDSRETLMFLHQVIIELNREAHSCQQKMAFPAKITITKGRKAFIWDAYSRSSVPQDIFRDNQFIYAHLGEQCSQLPFDPGGFSSAV